MSSKYEFWLLEDTGQRLALLNPEDGPGISFFDYSRSLQGLGAIHFGMPLDEYKTLVPYPWKPDRMLDVWRSPSPDFEMLREGIWFIRKFNIYTRTTDHVTMIEFWGRDPKDLINRRFIVQPSETSYTRKSGRIDDMMKQIVREQMEFGYAVGYDGITDPDREWPQGEFSVEGENSLGPNITDPISIVDKNAMDVMKQLRDLSLQMNLDDPANRRIYFDVLPGASLDWNQIWILDEAAAFEAILDENGDRLLDESSLAAIVPKNIYFQFQTFADVRGMDRTNGTIFSVENGNFSGVSYTIDELDEQNTIIMHGQGMGAGRLTVEVQDSEASHESRWARVEDVGNAASEVSAVALESDAKSALVPLRRKRILDGAFLNSPGSEDTPRSLYRVDWDLGDRLPVLYAGEAFNADVVIVYVSQDDHGNENISGRTSSNE